MNPVIVWLLESEPYVAYRTRIDLLEQPSNDPDVLKARNAMLAQPKVKALLTDLSGWPGDVITNHKKAGLLIHKLAFAAELGITVNDPGIESVVQSIMAHITEQGIPEVPLNIPKCFGGTGEAMWTWALCDTPRLLFCLFAMGYKNEILLHGADVLAELIRENGWPCAASPALGRFRGPGKTTDTCPYATLLMLSVLLQSGQPHTDALYTGAESLLTLWQNSREQHPFLFHMGTDFRKLKAPFVWYDILHASDVLSQFSWLFSDIRLLEMIDSIQSKSDTNGTYKPESIWTAWKGWDFAQKKVPSPWLTFLVLRILKRVGKG